MKIKNSETLNKILKTIEAVDNFQKILRTDPSIVRIMMEIYQNGGSKPQRELYKKQKYLIKSDNEKKEYEHGPVLRNVKRAINAGYLSRITEYKFVVLKLNKKGIKTVENILKDFKKITKRQIY